MTQTKMTDPGRAIALIALEDQGYRPAVMLEDVVKTAFDQLCFYHSTPKLVALLADLQAVLEADDMFAPAP